MKKLIVIFTFLISASVFGADYTNDILLVSVGESSDRYSEVAVHLQEMLTNTTDFADTQVTIVEDSSIESLADGYYDKNSADVTLRSNVALGYRYVILIPTIITTPNGTIEYTEYSGGPTDVYDDDPLDNEYFAPEVFYEGCSQLSKLILNAGSTPMVFLPDNADEDLADFGPVMYRVANGVGIQLIPGAYALDSAGVTTDAETEYLYACSIYSQITGLNASTANYTPSGIESADAESLADTAESAVILHNSTTHYEGSYESDGAVVYRSLDVSSEPFNDVVRYMYKGSSTHDWTSDALTLMISSNSVTTRAARKLGTLNGFNDTGVRYWHPDDITDQGYKFALEPHEAQFMYVSGSWEGADAQDCIDLTQTNMIPMAFDWIKSFAIGGEEGTDATLDALDYHDCNELYFNYAERGWKLIPLTIGMGRLNESVDDFAASDDGLHCSDLLVYMNAYMMLSSALGAPFPFPEEIPAEEIHRGSHTTEEIQEACLIGHEIITELAFLSETSAAVPDSDLSVVTDSLPGELVGISYSSQLQAEGGEGAYTWEIVSGSSLPLGLSLSSDGVISGDAYEDGSWNVVVKVTDEQGSFRKGSLKLTIEANDALPIASADSVILMENTTEDILLTGADSEGSTLNLTYEVFDWPTNGTLSGTAPDLTYSPNTDFVGEDSFTFKVSDGVNVSVPATVSVSVGSALMDLEFVDLNAALTGNTLMVGGSTDSVAVTGVAAGSNYVYSVTYTGADYDYDGTNDTVTFDVLVEAWDSGTITALVDASTTGTEGADGAAIIGTTDVAVDRTNSRFSAGSATMNAGKTVEFNLQNLNVSLTDGSKSGYVGASGFVGGQLIETGSGYGHRTVIGEGEGLMEFGWNNTTVTLPAFDTDSAPLYISSATFDGTSFSPQKWSIKDADFGINVVAWDSSINQIPDADAQSVTTTVNTPLDITLTGLDVDEGSSGLTYTVDSQPTNGTLSGTAPALTYTPTDGYFGEDSFTFIINDGETNSVSTMVSIVINDPPVADAQSVELYRNSSVDVTLTGSDVDGPNDLTYTVISAPSNGELSGTAPDLAYTPTIGYSGVDSFTFTVNDGSDDSTEATVSISVNNNVPVVDGKVVLTQPETAVSILLSGSDADDAPSSLTFSVVSNPINGTLSGTAPNLTYTPAGGFIGTDSFTYKANDGADDSAEATVSITISADGLDLSFLNLDGSLLANSLSVGGSTNNLTVSGVSTNSDYLYSVTYTGADYDGDTTNDTVSFDVRVKAWTDGTTEMDLEVLGSTNTASATIGTNSAQVSLTGDRFNVTDTQMQDGESLEFILENLALSLTDATKSGNVNSTGFTSAQLEETASGHSHHTIFGEGTGLLGWDWNANVTVTNIDVGTDSLYISSDFADGSNTRPYYWGVGDLDFGISVSVDSGYATWLSDNGLTDDDALPSADVENGGVGDGYNNLVEFALGMNPAISDAGSMESLSTAVDGGTNYYEYVHYRRSDYTNQGLTYLLIDSLSLVDSILSTNAQDQIITGPAVDGYEPVTNRYLIDGTSKFIRLKIGQD